jgi:hypothetical protein
MGEGAASARAAALSARAAHPLAEEAERVAQSISGRLGEAPAAAAGPQSPTGGSARASEPEVVRPPAAAADASVATAVDAPAAAEDAAADGGGGSAGGPNARGGVRGRAAAVGARAGETLKPRVERLREASSVVIDEAADDPGVRFLVVAAVLFLLFLLLWLLSFTLG